MASYRYLFADLLTNSILAELELTGVSFTQTLNAAGTMQGQILLSGLNATASNVSAATIPARCAIYIDRDGVLIWGGVIWNRTYDSESQHLAITAREFESYYERRRITTTQVFSNVDQLFVAQQIMTTANAATGGNIGVAIGTETSGVLVSRTYYSYELKTVYSALQDLSQQQNGFDFNIQVAYDGAGNPTKALRLSYPQSGTRYSATSPTALVFEFPAGNTSQYSYPEDGSLAANLVYVVGAGSNEGKQILSATDSVKLTAGWPLLEDSANYSDTTDLTLLGSLATGRIAAMSYPPTTMQIVTTPTQSPTLGQYSIGDDARIRITDERFPTGLDATYRIVALSVQAGENNQPERVTLTLSLPTS